MQQHLLPLSSLHLISTGRIEIAVRCKFDGCLKEKCSALHFSQESLYICNVIHFIRISVIKRINDMMMKSRNRKLVNLVFSKHQTKATHTDVYGAYDAK